MQASRLLAAVDILSNLARFNTQARPRPGSLRLIAHRIVSSHPSFSATTSQSDRTFYAMNPIVGTRPVLSFHLVAHRTPPTPLQNFSTIRKRPSEAQIHTVTIQQNYAVIRSVYKYPAHDRAACRNRRSRSGTTPSGLIETRAEPVHRVEAPPAPHCRGVGEL